MNIKKILGIFICIVTIITVYTSSEHSKVYALYCEVDQIGITGAEDSAYYSIYFTNTVSECNPYGYTVRIEDLERNIITKQVIPNIYEDGILEYDENGKIVVKAYNMGGGWTAVPFVYTDIFTGDTRIAGWNITNRFNPKDFGLGSGDYYISTYDSITDPEGDNIKELKQFTVNVSVPTPPSGGGNTGGGNTGGGNTGGGDNSGSVDASLAQLKESVSKIYAFIFPIAILILIIKILISIITITTSGGDPNNLNKAKEELFSTLTGFLLIAGAVTLINILGSALGV